MILPFTTQFPDHLHQDLANRKTHFIERILASMPHAEVKKFYLEKYDVVFLSKQFKTLLQDKASYTFNNDLYFLFLNIADPKKHTIRKDVNKRWKPGLDIHFFINVRTNKMFQFAPVIQCISVQKIEINYKDEFSIFIDGIKKINQFHHTLALKDGFSSLREFKHYFNSNFKGRLIHWTNERY
jgi:hypothetical protein